MVLLDSIRVSRVPMYLGTMSNESNAYVYGPITLFGATFPDGFYFTLVL